MQIKINYKILVLILGIVLILSLAGNFWLMPKNKLNLTGSVGSSLAEPVLAKDIYPLFFCPCCGQPLDKNNICCDAAKEMIDYIDSQVEAGLSKNEVIIQVVKKYGVTSVVESERAQIEELLAKEQPSLLPTEKLSFSQAIGKKAPEFSLENLEGQTVKLSDYQGKNIVLFFNEGAMCYPACWDQIEALANDERFNTDDVATFSIVVDQKSEWEEITKQIPQLAEAKILFDTTRIVSLTYDVLSLVSSMHPGSYPGHTYFIIDKEGVIRFTADDPNMAIWNDRLTEEIDKLL